VITILPVTRVGTPEHQAFLTLPHVARAGDPLWAPQSTEAADWAFAEAARIPMRAFVAVDGGDPVARAAAFTPGGPVGTVGLFECLPRRGDVGRAVLEECVAHLGRRGVRRIEAPRSDPLTVGLQVGGFDLPQTLFTTHDPPFHLEVMLAAGFHVVRRMVAPLMTRATAPRLRPPPHPPGITIRPVDPDRLESEVAALGILHRAVFAGAPGRVGIAYEDNRRLVRRILPYLDPDMVVVADHAGTAVGSLLCFPDAWQANHVDRARILSIGVLPGWERRGLGLAMGARLMRVLLDKGFQSVEGVWVREENVAPQALARVFGARPGRTFALLERSP
jgi:GNAT superfamily N-acetyltransferase